ncbi:hypothetical protein ZYGR_0AD02130 [Zygosaccharomyces rouxii]|uniref:SWR1-complex protein 4 n=2 Tax=Zygosaccharomyces rouxii TaxID=4956 RepID=C5E097_ZYGRC|nr:uncharacterized protein ZYRO0G10912g [Zygosaccharomyces rouxii]KAH9202525.1 hypothetical protein LQ764DRAFT_227006 [Zygosaccharomyces rouxii]GAV51030.1 hypothetical protein ZYGR_0AD02130 [Zygosaccharomyces rouxii]CAR29531.1 ZYRO0G10912p [Zygosaccharomyces rouxii]
MSSSDILDVLNIQQKPKSHGNSASPPPTASASGASKAPRPQVTGMQRELYNLLGENQPPIVVQPASRFKDKLTNTTKPSPWTNAEFKANDHLNLHHWVKGSKELVGEEAKESSYTKFNVHLRIPSFDKETYESFMANNIPNEELIKKEDSGTSSQEDTDDWEYEEVDYLFQLCRKYDLRWFVIQDRYNYGRSRTLEELKEKFYKVCQRYFVAKSPNDPLLPSLDFPKEKELERKKYLQRLLARSAAEIAEEEALIVESRKFEMAAKKTLNERESLLRLLDSPNSDQSVSQYLTSQGMSQLYGSLLSDKSRKRKHESTVPENPWMKQQQLFALQRQQLQQIQDKKQETQDTNQLKKTKRQKQEMQTAIKRKAETVYAEHLLEKFSADERKSLGVMAHGDKLPPGVYLRSSKISTFKPALQSKVAAMLQELGLSVRPAMPSYDVVQRHEELLKRIVALVDLKKHLDKLEAEKAITK